MKKYYLWIEVEPFGEVTDGWQWARWPEGKEFKHWAAQLREEPLVRCPR